MKTRCEICDGTQKIRLPLYGQCNRIVLDDGTVGMEVASKEFPCPNCQLAGPYKDFHVIQQRRRYKHLPDLPEEYMASVRNNLAHALVEALMRYDCIRFTEHAVDEGNPMLEERGLQADIYVLPADQHQHGAFEQHVEDEIAVLCEDIRDALDQLCREVVRFDVMPRYYADVAGRMGRDAITMALDLRKINKARDVTKA